MLTLGHHRHHTPAHSALLMLTCCHHQPPHHTHLGGEGLLHHRSHPLELTPQSHPRLPLYLRIKKENRSRLTAFNPRLVLLIQLSSFVKHLWLSWKALRSTMYHYYYYYNHRNSRSSLVWTSTWWFRFDSEYPWLNEEEEGAPVLTFCKSIRWDRSIRGGLSRPKKLQKDCLTC